MEYTEHQQSLLRKLEQLQKDEGLSLSALSARLGISKGALSQLFSGSYQANPQKMFAKLESYFGVKDQTRQTYQESGYADTSTASERSLRRNLQKHCSSQKKASIPFFLPPHKKQHTLRACRFPVHQNSASFSIWLKATPHKACA